MPPLPLGTSPLVLPLGPEPIFVVNSKIFSSLFTGLHGAITFPIQNIIDCPQTASVQLKDLKSTLKVCK